MKTAIRGLAPLILSFLFSFTSAWAVVFTSDTSIGTLDTSYDGQDVVVSNCTVTIDGAHAFNSFRLATGGTLTHTASSNDLSLTLTNDLQVELGGVINLTGRGFDGNSGTGNGGEAGSPQSGAGAGHGGYGGLSSSNALGGNCYGVFDQPVTLGSGGGQGATSVGGSGGGAIKLVIGGSALIEGVISANGANATNSRSGGGSGGSVWIVAQTVTGAGTITANGGNGEPIHGGGGGGGRIAIHSDTNNFTGTITAFGGQGWKIGGAGTIYTKPTTSTGLLLVDNGGNAGTNSLVSVTNQADVVIRGKAVVIPGTWNSGNVIIASNSFVIPTTTTITMTMTGNCIVEVGAGILANGAGSASGTGSGAGQYSFGGSGGAGHGGRGATVVLGAFSYTGGVEYGSMTTPILVGSGGGGFSSAGGRGGGAVRITVGGMLLVNGVIAVNATSATTGNAGGGSGGSIYITTQGFEGDGDIQAKGGDGHIIGGGGAGGRIAVYFASNSFTGVIQATGGNATTNVGGAGTIYLKPATSLGNLIVDNGGFHGATTGSGATAYDSVTVQGGGKLVGGASFLSRNLTVRSNSWLLGLTTSPTMTLTITGHVSIEHTAGIKMNGVSTGGSGNGNSTAVSGGSYGGSGGSVVGTSTAITYGSTSIPSSAGSIGGSLTFGGNIPYGGGVIVVSGGGTMQLDGLISADGIMAPPGLATSNGTITHSPNGGGSGGSVRLNVRSLAGTGSISANGGDGVGGGGGGGGGRIAIYCNTNTLTGPITAYGGGALPGHPNYPGGAGTIYFNSYSGNTATGFVLVDNGGQLGGFTSTANATLPGVFNGVVTNGANFSTTHSFSNLTVYPNSSIISSPINASNLTVFAGGAINLDGRGTNTTTGNAINDRGAGHGGYGGRSTNNVSAGGTAYDSITQPTATGSYVSPSPFSPGGGAAMINVTETFILNGRLSADATPIFTVGRGAGSGGSIWLNVGTLSGSGLISANGGDCVNGGGGGGGRIAVYYNSNSFTGNISVRGGTGFNTGGAGTIYTKANNTSVGQLLVDGSGLVGEQTPLSTNYSLPNLPFDLTVAGGATVLPIPPFPILSNLWVGAGSTMTMRTNETNLFLHVLRDVTIAAGGSLIFDGKGFGQLVGPGAGWTVANTGSGAGYGGIGGNSSVSGIAGAAYGSATKPVDRGSGGGSGANSYFGGSEGGGAVQMIVGGTLTVDGSLSANGNPGLQDDSGGGSGGSIWISAGALTGSGNISATGGDGDLFGGGGGGGGRIAIYSPTNTFAGDINVNGGFGANSGQTGTIFLAASLATNTISGTVTNLQGNPQQGALIQPTDFAATTTDVNGNYVLELPMGWTGAVTPTLGTNSFVPSTRSYTSLNSDFTNANYLTVASVTPVLSSGLSETNLVFNWSGVPGVAYLPYWSTNLSDWLPIGGWIQGSNGVMQLLIPANDVPYKFVRVRAFH